MLEPRPRWSETAKAVVSILLVALGVFLLSRFSAVLKPAILALVIAFILTPMANYFQERLKLHRVLAILLAYLVLIAVLIALPLAIIRPLGSQLVEIKEDIPRILSQIQTLLGHQYQVAGLVVDVNAVFQQFVASIQRILEPVIGQTLNALVEVISSVAWVVFTVVISFYLIKDGDAVRQWLENMAPPAYRPDYIRLRDEINRIWGAFFRGQLALALFVGALFMVIGFILGLPFFLAMAAFAGLMEFLPTLGHAIWLFTASILAFFLGSTHWAIPNWIFMLIIIGLHLVFEQFDLNYLIPRIVGRNVHLPPLVVILGIFAGAVLAGVLGILLAAPTIASARVVGRYVYANLFDMEPFPESIVSPLPPPNPRWWHKVRPQKQDGEGSES
jgi:predicted PurR-regulated permease PerM